MYGCWEPIDERIKHIEMPRQIEKMELFCKQANAYIMSGFADKTSGGLNRVGVQQMLKEILKNKKSLDFIVVTYWRHLTRDPREMMQLIDALYSEEIQVFSTHDPDDSWYESIIYKFKSFDLENTRRLRAKGIFCVKTFNTKIEELIE